MAKKLFIGDLAEQSVASVYQHLLNEYGASKSDIKKYQIIVAYESVGDYGCDSSSYFLLKDKLTNEYYEVHGSHCSCYGFEDQFTPVKAEVAYLKSDNFGFSTGGYDQGAEENKKRVKQFFLKNLL